MAAYRNLRDRTLRGERMFVAEGSLLVMRLLASRFAADSLLVAEPRAAEFLPHVPADVPIYVATESLVQAIIGFHLHQGVLAAGRRRPEMSLEVMLGPPGDRPLGIIVCPQITKPENMGLIFRVAAGLGADGLRAGPAVLRSVFAALPAGLDGRGPAGPLSKVRRIWPPISTALRDRWGVEMLAAVLDDRAVPLARVRWPRRAAVMLGNEFDGLGDPWLEFCTQRVTIPMARADRLAQSGRRRRHLRLRDDARAISVI